MSELKRRLEVGLSGFQPREDVDGAVRRARSRQRNRRITAATLSLVITVAGVAVAARQFSGTQDAALLVGAQGELVFSSNHDWPPDGPLDLYAMRPDGVGLRRLTNTVEVEAAPSVSPNGNLIAFVRSDRRGLPHLFIMRSDGTGQRDLGLEVDLFPPSWSPDGLSLAVVPLQPPCAGAGASAGCKPERRIQIVSVEDGSITGTLPGCEFPACAGDSAPSWSPDGTRMALARALPDPSDPTHIYSGEIFVMDLADESVRRMTHGTGGASPTWSPNGQLLLATVDGDVVTIDPDNGRITALAEGGEDYLHSPVWSPNGTSVAFLRPTGPMSFDAWAVRADGEGALMKLRETRGSGSSLSWGPRTADPVPGPTFPGLEEPFIPGSLAFFDDQRGIAAGGGIGLTSDGGRTWRRVYRGSQIVSISVAGEKAFAVSYACGPATDEMCRTLLGSVDGGETWSRLGTEDRLVSIDFISPTDGWGLLDVSGSGRRLGTSHDGGLSWDLRPNPCPGRYRIQEIARASRQRGWLICSAPGGTGAEPKILYSSSDDGRTWSMVSASGDFDQVADAIQPMGDFPGNGIVEVFDIQEDGFGAMSFERYEPNITLNGGRTWSALELEVGMHSPSARLASLVDGRIFVLYSTLDEVRLIRSDDFGQTWDEVGRWDSPWG